MVTCPRCGSRLQREINVDVAWCLCGWSMTGAQMVEGLTEPGRAQIRYEDSLHALLAILDGTEHLARVRERLLWR